MSSGNFALETLYSQLDNLQFDFRNKNLNNLVFSKLRGKTIIDVGCGPGHFLMLAKNNGMDVYGIEPNLKLLTLAKNLYKNLQIKAMKAEDLHRLKKKFDNVVLMDVIEHIQDDVKILKSVKNLLSKNGRLIIITSAFPFLYGIRDKKVGHFRRYTKRALITKLETAGYSVHEVKYWDMIGFFPYFIVEKIFNKNLLAPLRQNKKRSIGLRILNLLLDFWFKNIENRVSFGFGLTLLVVAKA